MKVRVIVQDSVDGFVICDCVVEGIGKRATTAAVIQEACNNAISELVERGVHLTYSSERSLP